MQAKIRYPSLESTIQADVAIVGGGITGIVSAYLLAKAGKTVVLLEKESLLSGETSRTTAFLTYVTDARLKDLHGRFGDDGAKRIWETGKLAIDEIERIVQEEKIECGFMRVPAYVYAADDAGLRALEGEAELANAFGFPVELHQVPFAVRTPGYLEFPEQAKYDAAAFLTALAARAAALGVRIFEHSSVTSFEGEGNTEAVTAKGRVTASEIILATHSPIDEPIDAARLTPFRTFVIKASIPRGALPEAIYWDSLLPYHYFRVDQEAGSDRITLGGLDSPCGAESDAASNYVELKAYLEKLVPGASAAVKAEWSGEVLVSADGAPYIGRSLLHKHHWIATGFNGNGMTFGVASAMMLRDFMTGAADETKNIFTPKRIKGMLAMMKRGTEVMGHMISGHFAPSTGEVADLAPGEGTVVSDGLRQVAVYRSEKGKISACSAVCTHLGCIVGWNKTEKSWDCPCHGSRFAPDGSVINGPAMAPLPPVDTETDPKYH